MSEPLPELEKRSRFKRLAGLYHPATLKERGLFWACGLLLATYLVIALGLSFWWGQEPPRFDVKANALALSNNDPSQVVVGSTTTAAVITAANTLLNKPGGYLSNDVTLPGVLMDNIPNWEFGVLIQLRDVSRALRNEIGRSQSQSIEDVDLARAEPQFNFQNDSWIFPSSEGEYRQGIEYLITYHQRLAQSGATDAQFYARADNLREWLAIVEKRLGSLSQRLSASVGQIRINTDLAGEVSAVQSTAVASEVEVKTPWLEIDDVFYEARGTSWALIHIMHAIEIDFAEILDKKNARVSLRQIVRELEATQESVWSPMVLNGGGFGIVTNYSLVMANYISRANAAVIDLRNLLEQG